METLPVSMAITEQGIASECEVCSVLSLNRASMQEWKNFKSSERDIQDDSFQVFTGIDGATVVVE